MDLEQLSKKLEWLDEERRKDKITIESLKERIASLEGEIPPFHQQINDLSSDLTRFSAALGRFEQIDSTLAQMRVETARQIDSIEKMRNEHDREIEKVRRADLESLNKGIFEVRRGLDPIPDIKKQVQARVEEEFRLSRLIEETDHKLDESIRSDEEYRRSLKLLEEGRRQDAKRITDLQGEVASFRKRIDEQRGKIDITAEIARKVDLRINEIQAAETERRQTQNTFIERQTMATVERDRVWKEMQARFEDITKQALGLDSQIQTLDATHRSVKRSQEAFDEITQRFERRINEITEMQRLVEDRFRQEWVAFKADDQKRWTNYSLSGEEQHREVAKQFEKLAERIVFLEDLGQELQDAIHQVTEETAKRLQGLVALAHQWTEEYSRTFGRSQG